ncbi:NAD(P)H-dependent oxidoreductase [Aduncisulcus paluster]|uniref:NAD(P)H-dependent oxidoreductase n=1 Tax=Aduncisulcus paluster TaxID=2918883 RepID=A0ABQ5KQG4_9EUKA|nr:NAD(P)H-dependent oxidoreductase [Aduncisulcus paluster]
MTVKILAIFGHPALESTSVMNKKWLHTLTEEGLENVTIHKLSEAQITPFSFDIKAEQDLLVAHDRILFIFPMFWYGLPALVKKWIDDVLTHGFAFGSTGTALKDKEFRMIISTGAPASDYVKEGPYSCTFDDFLLPIKAVSIFTGMIYKTPVVFHGCSPYTPCSDEEKTKRITIFMNTVKEE